MQLDYQIPRLQADNIVGVTYAAGLPAGDVDQANCMQHHARKIVLSSPGLREALYFGFPPLIPLLGRPAGQAGWPGGRPAGRPGGQLAGQLANRPALPQT